MKQQTTHDGQLVFLKKIEGQIRGIQKMIAQRRYCVDIITQIHSIIGALYRVEDQIFKKHLDSCVANAMKEKSERQKQEKIDEIMELVARFRKTA
jgi:DNA-binding FrmR family transcriptional regulator